MTERPSDNQETALVVSSCDAYSDAWPPFFALLSRYWPDCPYPIYLISNQEVCPAPNVTTLCVDTDQGWASNLRDALQRIPGRRVLYFQEDYFLQRRVDTERIRSVIEFADARNAGYIRLCGAPDPDVADSNAFGLGQLSPRLKFRVSLQAALWRRDTLTALLVPGETGWQMEQDGSRRSAALPVPFFGTPIARPLIDYYYFTGILKGKWVPGALRLCRREGIAVDLTRRGVHSEWPFVVRRIRALKLVRSARAVLRRARRAA